MTFDLSQASRQKLLLVGDAADRLHNLAPHFTQWGYEARQVADASAALQAIAQDPPHVVLLGLHTPPTDGYGFCQLLQANPLTQAIPVMFLSDRSEAIDRARVFASGGADVLIEPISELELRVRLSTQLRGQRPIDSAMRQVEQLAILIAHNLQPPLQNLVSFTKLLRLKYQAQFDETAEDYLDGMLDSIERLQQLSDDLSFYAAIETHDRRSFAAVDCSVLLEQVLDDLRTALADNAINLTSDSLPVVWGNETQITRLFQQLLSNAIKFVQLDASAQIQILVTPIDRSWQFEVRDNGVGILPEDLPHLFNISPRLPSQSRYWGTGIGLALCKKIVEHHTGEIWIESLLDIGTRVFFTLPQFPQSIE